MSDDARFWRVYKREFTVVYTSDTDGEAGMKECHARFLREYEGRVRVEDSRVEPWSKSDPGRWPWMLQLALPVMKGEYAIRPLALEHADRIGGIAALEGGRTDRRLLRYGRQMLGDGDQSVDSAGAARGEQGPSG